MDVDGWTKTKKGRVVFDTKPNMFRSRDAARILTRVLDFDNTLDNDFQTYSLFLFLFEFGFLPVNLTSSQRIIPRTEQSIVESMIENAVYKVAGSMGIPELAQTFAKEMGTFLVDLVFPQPTEYVLPSAFVQIMLNARDYTKEEKGGFEWRAKQEQEKTRM